MGNFRILSNGSSELRIEASPIYWAGIFFVLVALVALLVLSGSVLGRRGGERTATLNGVTMRSSTLGKGWKTPLIAGIIFLVTGYVAFAMLQESSLTINQTTREFVVDRGYGLLGHLKYGGPTSAIAFATMETDASAQRFVLVLQDGQRVSLGSFSDAGGQSEAVAAVNRFLNIGEHPHE